MPFLAQGGSSVVTNWIIIALLLRLSDRARAPRPEESPAAPDGPAATTSEHAAGAGSWVVGFMKPTQLPTPTQKLAPTQTSAPPMASPPTGSADDDAAPEAGR